MVAEFAILFRIKHLQQSRGRVAVKVENQLVDFIHHKDRVARLVATQGLENASWHSSDICAAMAANLSLITYTT